MLNGFTIEDFDHGRRDVDKRSHTRADGFSGGSEGESSYGIECVAARRRILDVAVVARDHNRLSIEIGGFQNRPNESRQERNMLPRETSRKFAISLVTYAIRDEVFVQREVVACRKPREIASCFFGLALFNIQSSLD